MDSLSTLGNTTDLEKVEELSPSDVLNHFTKHIFPDIKERFFPQPVKPVDIAKKLITGKIKWSLFDIFKKKDILPIKEEVKIEEIQKGNMDDVYKEFGAAVAKGIFELVVGNHTHDIKRINLFLDVLYMEMTSTAYINSSLDFIYCAETFEKEGAKDKSRIIKEALKLCDEKFWKGVTTIQFSEDHLIFHNGYGTTLQSKKDFFKKD